MYTMYCENKFKMLSFRILYVPTGSSQQLRCCAKNSSLDLRSGSTQEEIFLLFDIPLHLIHLKPPVYEITIYQFIAADILTIQDGYSLEVQL